MRFRARLLLLFLLTGAASAAGAIPAGPDIRDTRLLSEPAVSAERVAFIYAGDLWTCALDGRDVRRVTSDHRSGVGARDCRRCRRHRARGRYLRQDADALKRQEMYFTPSPLLEARRWRWRSAATAYGEGVPACGGRS